VEDAGFLQEFLRSSAATLAVVGSFDEPTLRKKTVKSQLSGLESPAGLRPHPASAIQEHGYRQGIEPPFVSTIRPTPCSDHAGNTCCAMRLARLPGCVHEANYILGDGFPELACPGQSASARS
jgi:hypothetical protein